MDVRRLLVGPRDTALRVGGPVVVTAFAVAAVSAVVYLEVNEPGVYFPLDAAVVALAASAVYAARYRAVVVCVAVGVAAFAGSTVGFHVLHGDGAFLATLARFVAEPEGVAIGAVVGVVGAAVGGAVGRAVRFRRRAAS